MKHFEHETMYEIFTWLTDAIASLSPGKTISFKAPMPDQGSGLYAGELFKAGGRLLRHRGYRAWVDTAELLGCRMLTPRIIKGDEASVLICFEKIYQGDSFHEDKVSNPTEKYGVSSCFSRISKLEDPTFLAAFKAAVERIKLGPGARILDLGVNTGSEFELLRLVCSDDVFERLYLVGVDHSGSAIEAARENFSGPNFQFNAHDINDLSSLDLGRFDLIISIGTLQSSSIKNFKKLFMTLVQDHLTPGAAVILGFPNSRWIGGENVYGAKAKNYPHPEMSVLLNDIDFCRRYLSQHKFRVTLTGKSYIFLTATKIIARI